MGERTPSPAPRSRRLLHRAAQAYDASPNRVERAPGREDVHPNIRGTQYVSARRDRAAACIKNYRGAAAYHLADPIGTDIERGRLIDTDTQSAPVAQVDILWDDWKRLIARVRTGPPSDFGRQSYWMLGPADSTNGFINWVNTPLNSRVAFQIRTRDRRIQGAGGPTTPGKYFGYSAFNIFAASRGTWRYSHYYYLRTGTGTSWQTGAQLAVTVAEMDLLKAEALIRLNRAAEAVTLINKTRVANGQLPPVTLSGPPDEPGCVPRKLSGQCGSLWNALLYEKGVEMIGVDGNVRFFDSRGWQLLPEGSFTQLPIPGRELSTLRLNLYTFGGPGGQSSSPAPDPERCPVALPRCPA